MSRAFLALLRRDLVLATRAGGGGELALVFFLTLVVLVPFALGPDLNLLSRIGPAIASMPFCPAPCRISRA